MAERVVQRSTLRAGTPLHLGPLTLLPIERTVMQLQGSGGPGAWCSIVKSPHALLVRDGAGLRVLETGAGPLSLDRLRGEVAQLDALLASI